MPASGEGAAVPMLVVTRHQDHVEAINSTLRRAGHAVHCTWLPDARDLPDALIQINPEMVIVFADEGLVDFQLLAQLRTRMQPAAPVVVVRAIADEATVLEALRQGAQDVVTLANRERLQLVCARELRAFRLGRTLSRSLTAAREYQQALQRFMAGSADAIAQVQEGIVVDANRAWHDLYRLAEPGAANGVPVMEFVDAGSQAALKGALVACLRGKWADHPLRVNAILADGAVQALELQLSRTEFEGDPAIRVSVPAHRHDDAEMQRLLAEAMQTDPGTGLLHSRYFVAKLRDRLRDPVRGGVRFIAFVRPDRIDETVRQIGLLQSEDFIAQMAALVRDQAQPGDLAGRFSGSGVMLLLERGTPRDAEAWAAHVVRKIGAHVFRAGDRTLSATATVGLALVPAGVSDPVEPVNDAYEATRKGRERGGNQVCTGGRAKVDMRIRAFDRNWVRHVETALADDRFRLVQQPIASLRGEDRDMFDVLVRMLDAQGREVLPSEFLPAAARNGLMQDIDRWVMGASVAFCAARSPETLFIRLSRDTVNDRSVPLWLSNRTKASAVQPGRLCVQVDESVATQYLLQTQEMRESLGAQGFRFAIGHFGAGADPAPLLERLRPEFVKVDGTLMQGLAGNAALQQKVGELAEIARQAGAVTIAERVGDANTMAVLWQLGIEFIQGYLVHKPEEVVLG